MSAPHDRMDSPYRGLTPYTEEDAAYFFGRDDDTRNIAANLEVARLTLFYGPSGVGKSSVLRAGALKRLREKAQATRRPDGTPEMILVYFSQWQSAPLDGLRAAIVEALRPFGEPENSGDSLAAQLRGWTAQFDSELLIILDQFEEYFLYSGSETGPGTFAHEWAQAVNMPGLRVNFLLSLRDDALAKLDRFKGSVPALLDNRLDIRHLARAAAQEAIECPLARYNEAHGTSFAIEPALTAQILDEVARGRVALGTQGAGGVSANGGAGEIETPYLQLVLTRLWEEEQANGSEVLCQATLAALGGAEAIVRNYLKNTMETLPAHLQATAAAFFDRLVTPSGTKIALTVDELSAFAHKVGATDDEVRDTLHQLQVGRILRPVTTPAGVTQYEIFHDVLARAVLEWQSGYAQQQEQLAAQRRLEEEAQAALEQEKQEREKLEIRAQEAAKRAELEQRSNQRLRWLVGAMALLAGVAILSSLFAVDRSREATTAKATAEAARVRAEDAQKSAEEQARISLSLRLVAESGSLLNTSQPVLGLLTAVEAVRRPLDNRKIIQPEAMEQMHTILGRVGGIPLHGHEGNISTLAFSPDGQWLAIGSSDLTARLWNVDDPQQVPLLLSGHEEGIITLAFSPDGQWLATGSDDGTARLWNVDDPQQVPLILSGHTAAILTLAFSPDGQWLATGSADRTARLWNVDDPQQVPLILSGHKVVILTLAFSPDGHWLATGSLDSTARLWNVDNPQQDPLLLSGHASAINTLAFSPDGHWLATGSRDKTARLWTISVEQLIEKACAVAGRNFTREEWAKYFPNEPYRATCEGLPVPEAE